MPEREPVVAEVCAALRTVRRRIASDWQALYKTVYRVVPTG
jgi:hypothetical protein